MLQSCVLSRTALLFTNKSIQLGRSIGNSQKSLLMKEKESLVRNFSCSQTVSSSQKGVAVQTNTNSWLFKLKKLLPTGSAPSPIRPSPYRVTTGIHQMHDNQHFFDLNMHQQITTAAKVHQVFTDVLDLFTPKLNLVVQYEPYEDDKGDDWTVVFRGNILHACEVLSPPKVRFQALCEQDYYTLWLISPDEPSRAHPTMGAKVLWTLTNIKGSQPGESSGDTLLAYKAPMPMKNSGQHRYVFVLTQHTNQAPLSSEQMDEIRSNFDWSWKTFSSKKPTQSFKPNQIFAQHDLKPVGLSFFQSEYDEQLKEVWAYNNLPQPMLETDIDVKKRLSFHEKHQQKLQRQKGKEPV